MVVEEQRLAETRARRRIELLNGARLGFIPLALFGAVCLAVAVADGNGRATALFSVSTALAVILCAYWTAAIRRLRRRASVTGSAAGPPKTHAEDVAEAVEAIRQRQWDAITGRAFLAAGGAVSDKRRAAYGQQVVARPRTREGAPVARPDSGAVELDPRWEWQLVRGLGVPDRWVKARCLHTDVERVKSVAGEVVAQLCLTCDTQFPAPCEG